MHSNHMDEQCLRIKAHNTPRKHWSGLEDAFIALHEWNIGIGVPTFPIILQKNLGVRALSKGGHELS